MKLRMTGAPGIGILACRIRANAFVIVVGLVATSTLSNARAADEVNPYLASPEFQSYDQDLKTKSQLALDGEAALQGSEVLLKCIGGTALTSTAAVANALPVLATVPNLTAYFIDHNGVFHKEEALIRGPIFDSWELFFNSVLGAGLIYAASPIKADGADGLQRFLNQQTGYLPTLTISKALLGKSGPCQKAWVRFVAVTQALKKLDAANDVVGTNDLPGVYTEPSLERSQIVESHPAESGDSETASRKAR